DKKEGLISGVAGLMIGLGQLHNIKGACLMGETNAQLIYGDHGSAKRVLEVLSKKFNFKINMKTIEKDSKEIEKAFKELTQHLEAIEEEKPNEKLPYVR
ncbi:MAG: PAC2 family protein, partial [Candidatus ainarchaeum sp.]|nr:PAC2 family protein [Candidatus ainarchaeum sp.]